MVRQVQPLRISKSTPRASGSMSTSTSPSKPTMASPRPLAEIGSTERRRNSPSYNQASRKMIVSDSSSSYIENSFSFTKEKDSSPRTFWRSRHPMSPSHLDNSENEPDREPSPALYSSQRRASIEKLKQAGRVKTSNIFALESKDAYDPSTTPVVERPTNNRPLSQSVANNTFTRYDSLRKENNPLRSPGWPEHKRTESDSTPSKQPLRSSPRKDATPSPTKSSLARMSQFGSPMDAASGAGWSDGDDRCPTPRALHRQNKSVTFNEAPPELNEYENPTPEPSVSAASGSREGSWESDEYDPEYSFERSSSADLNRDDSFDEDLENAEKTPVVLPEDWSRMSPDDARTDLVDEGDDVFEGSPGPTRAEQSRSISLASDGESRPLPPLPEMSKDRPRSGIGAMAEWAAQAARNLPFPAKKVSYNGRDDNSNVVRSPSLPLEDPLKLITHPPGEDERRASKHSVTSPGIVEEITITNLDTGERIDVHVDETEVEDDSVIANLAEFANSPPKISRESILRKIRNSKYEFDDDLDDSELDHDEQPGRPSYAELARMHPDDPIPSREISRETSTDHIGDAAQECKNHEDIEIKEEPADEEGLNIADIPAFDGQTLDTPQSSPHADEYERHSSVLRHHLDYSPDDDALSDSRYSSVEPEAESTTLHVQQEDDSEWNDGKETLQDAMQLLTVRDYSNQEFKTAAVPSSSDMPSLPTYLSTDDFDFGLKKFITPSPPPLQERTQQLDFAGGVPVLEPSKAEIKDLPRPTYDGADFSPLSTPDSVIYHSGSEVSALEEPLTLDGPVERNSPIIPERSATIKTNGKLKTRPSATPADLLMMAEQRRLVSNEHPVPAIPQAFQAEFEQVTENEPDETEEIEEAMSSSVDGESKADSAIERSSETNHRDSKSATELNLSIPSLDMDEAETGFDLDQEFDRVIEGQKKGYLMRQNTKVVVASTRNFSNSSKGTVESNDNAPSNSGSRQDPRGGSLRNAHRSPRKPSEEQHLKTEPWNGKARRKSQRQTSLVDHTSGPAPPLPGQASALGVVDEDFAAGTSSLEDEIAEGVERGRLFVKVVGVKDLDLPITRKHQLSFQLTLDNGLHCVTTSNMELANTAPIGQEFELVVLNDLEFQLTLNTNLPPPPVVKVTAPVSPTKTPKHSKSASLSRFLTSPKKRAEKERQEREAMEAEERRVREEAQRKRSSTQPTAWDLLHELVNESNGAFARAYINLKAHEKQCFGRQLTVEVPCYNEWALEKDSAVVNSVRSKRGNTGPIRKPPYVIGNLELQLLYVPKPAGATDDEMPKSMSSAGREMNKAREAKEVVHEDHLSQQGGDCVHWRRRFFRLQGTRLTAYHEHTHQKRAVINMSKATRLVDDKTTLVADPKSGNPSSKSGRRKSAFAEEDEGYQYVEEGFRIRFANGETIDFYADNRRQKDAWMDALSQVIGKPDAGKKAATWTDLVLARERAEGEDAPAVPATTDVRDFTKQAVPRRKLSDRKPVSKSVPSSPVKNAVAAPQRHVPDIPIADHGVRPKTPPMSARRGHRSRDAVKSMIF